LRREDRDLRGNTPLKLSLAKSKSVFACYPAYFAAGKNITAYQKGGTGRKNYPPGRKKGGTGRFCVTNQAKI